MKIPTDMRYYSATKPFSASSAAWVAAALIFLVIVLGVMENRDREIASHQCNQQHINKEVRS